MTRYVRIQLNPTGTTYNVYSGISISEINDLACANVIDYCDFSVSNSFTGDTIYIKLESDECVEQIIEIYIGDSDCTFGISVQPLLVNIYLPDLICEKDTIFGIRKVLTGFSSPFNVWYDETTKRVYGTDADDFTRGNVFWFDPVTSTTSSDATYSNSVFNGQPLRYNGLRNSFIDPIYRRIFLVGSDFTNRMANTPTNRLNGLIVYDIDSDTHQINLIYGSNDKFIRYLLYVTNDYIFLNDINSLIRLDRDTLGNRLNIPTDSTLGILREQYLKSNPFIVEVKGFLWLVSSMGTPVVNGTRDIGVFDSAFNLVRTIMIPGVQNVLTTFGTCCDPLQNIFYDETSDKIYLNDAGSLQRFVIQPNISGDNGTFIFNESLSGISENRLHVFCSWTIDPSNNYLYENVSIFNRIGSSTYNLKTKLYLIDRNNFGYRLMINNLNVTKLANVNDGLSNSIMGYFLGLEYMSQTGDNYNTDGTITIWNNTIEGGNTGNVIVNKLKEYNTLTMLPTGNEKLNIPGDPDYVPSPYFDLTVCPLIYTYECPVFNITNSPTFITYEINFNTSTRLNPLIDYVRISAVTTTNVVLPFNDVIQFPLNTGYTRGIISGITSECDDLVIEYYDSSNVLLSICENNVLTTYVGPPLPTPEPTPIVPTDKIYAVVLINQNQEGFIVNNLVLQDKITTVRLKKYDNYETPIVDCVTINEDTPIEEIPPKQDILIGYFESYNDDGTNTPTYGNTSRFGVATGLTYSGSTVDLDFDFVNSGHTLYYLITENEISCEEFYFKFDQLTKIDNNEIYTDTLDGITYYWGDFNYDNDDKPFYVYLVYNYSGIEI